MPATEQTARDPKLLHKLFAISGALLLIATFWMLSDDHARSWKEYQRTWIGMENRKAAWEENVVAVSVNSRQESLEQELQAELAKLPSQENFAQFKSQVNDESDIQQLDDDYQELAAAIEQLNAAGEDAADDARDEVIDERNDLVATMRGIIADAKFEEDKLLGERKFASADLDAKRSDLGIAVRDDKPLEEIEVRVSEQEAVVAELNLRYQDAAKRRKALLSALDALLADELAIQKEIDGAKLELSTLTDAAKQRSSEFFTGDFPFLGKRWLELPILDAFNSPRKIDNLWTDNLTIDYNFRRVRRFDRCTTCHQGIDKPGGYVPEHDLAVTLVTPEAAPEGDNATLESIYGVLLGDISLTGSNEVTVHAVTPQSLAAAAEVKTSSITFEPLTPEAIRDSVGNPFNATEEEQPEPGLQMGDRIIRIGNNEILSLGQAQRLLKESVTWGEPVKLTIRRGVPHPFTAHPRLDLFLGSLSPHPLSRFGCTSCHEGQGNATEFKWVSHTPNTLNERKEWMDDHGWFNNHHWIYPMYPERFAESGCLKCHHNVTELAASDRFPEPPAPKLMQGHQLILKYGCFGCHEINGYNGSERIGPDMRLEPNFFAAALALEGDPHFDAVPDEVKDLVSQVANHPERDTARHELLDWLQSDSQSEEPILTPQSAQLSSALKDVETPGQLRKVGPSLRYASSKLDDKFVYDWLDDPRDFRPSTRMPRFFGQNAHLVGSPAMHTAETFQPIEILAISTYLLERSQEYEFLPAAEGMTASEEAEQIARGKQLFEVRGCLACHNHDDFPTVAGFRPDGEVPPGPDLSGVGSKFDPERNEHGKQWLYSWIKDPSSYNPRTIMPDLKLEPIKHASAQPTDGEATDAESSETVTDPIADIVAYLMSSQKEEWEAEQAVALPLRNAEQEALQDLALEFLQGAFYIEDAKVYYERGITSNDTDLASLKGAEVEMVVGSGAPMSDRQRLLYVGRKAIGKYGCYACHDIPGFEDAKPIGAALADWGRKDSSKLAFEHINEYLSHGHHGGGHDSEAHEADAEHDHEAHEGEAVASHDHADEHEFDYEHGGENLDPFYHHAIGGHERDGFIYQKLREPRSYDYHKAETKGYNEWLRMPAFPFDHEEREQVMTFVLGLVADPPAPEFVYTPDDRSKAIIEGKQVLAKYNCTGCHMLSLEEWDLAYQPGTFRAPAEAATYPFMTKEFSAAQLKATTAESDKLSEAGFLHAHLTGLPAIDNRSARPIVEVDEDGDLYELEPNKAYVPEELYYQFQLWEAVPLDGNAFQVGSVLQLPGTGITQRRAPYGGHLTRYLLPRVIELERAANPNANGSEAYGWLPPPLVNQGNKTQGDWLFSFLLDPHQIRPAVYLQMPKFNMSPDESRKLVNYFAARDNADFPYEYSQSQQQDYLARMEAQYVKEAEGTPDATTRLDDTMNIIVNKNYCVTCHLVGEYAPAGSDRAKAPNLAEVYKRLRYDYVFPWIANPKRILPYTSMPVNIPYDPNAEHLGGIPQDIYHGSSVEQVRALTDLLLNYDKYTKAKTQIDPLVEAAKGEAPAEGEQPAPETAEPPATEAAEPPAAEAEPSADTAPPEDSTAAPVETPSE